MKLFCTATLLTRTLVGDGVLVVVRQRLESAEQGLVVGCRLLQRTRVACRHATSALLPLLLLPAHVADRDVNAALFAEETRDFLRTSTAQVSRSS